MRNVEVIQPASFSVVSSDDMIAWQRVNDDVEADLFYLLVQAATAQFTNDTRGHVLCRQTFRLNLDHWPFMDAPRNASASYFPFQYQPYHLTVGNSIIKIPCAPVASVTLVEYLDTDAVWQVLGDWTTDLVSSVPARVILPTTLPQLHDTQLPRVRVTFTAGYNSGSVPALAAVGVRLMASHWWSNRSAYTLDNLKAVGNGWDSLCAQFDTGIRTDFNR